MFSINDELQDFKQRMQQLNVQIIKIEKVGNGNMAAFKMLYKTPENETRQEAFFWRHDMDRFEEKLKKSLHYPPNNNVYIAFIA